MNNGGTIEAELVRWTLNGISNVAQKLLKRTIQVKENRSAATRISILLAGITVSLAGKTNEDPNVDHLVEMFKSNTLSRIDTLIDECCERGYSGLYNAENLFNRLKEAEEELWDFISDLKLVLPYKDILAKYPADQKDAQNEENYRAESMNLSPILRAVCDAGRKVFTYRKGGKPMREVVDLVFLCDATGGMANGGSFDEVEERIIEVTSRARSTLEDRAGLLRVGLVAYRDVWDANDHIEMEDLTPEAGRVMSHVRRLVPTGGMDVAEDVVGGLEAAAKLSWTSYQNRKVLVHFADAPCHGAEYHTLKPNDDMLADLSKENAKCRARSPHAVLKKLACKNVIYIFVKMNGSTDKMIAKFRKIASREDFPTEVRMEDTTLSTKIVQAMGLGRPYVATCVIEDRHWPNPTKDTDTKKVQEQQMPLSALDDEDTMLSEIFDEDIAPAYIPGKSVSMGSVAVRSGSNNAVVSPSTGFAKPALPQRKTSLPLPLLSKYDGVAAPPRRNNATSPSTGDYRNNRPLTMTTPPRPPPSYNARS